MPELTKEALSKFIRTECRRQLRLYLSPDKQPFRDERVAHDMPPPQDPRPGLAYIREEGHEWEAEKLHDLREAFGPDAVVGHATTHHSGQTRYKPVELRDVLPGAGSNRFIVEAEFGVGPTFERAMGIACYRSEFGLVYGRVRPDIIVTCPPGRYARRVLPSGDVENLVSGDERLQLRVIDIKLTAEPSPSYFAEVTYYACVLAGWLADQGLEDRFVVVPDGAIWSGSHEAAKLTIAGQDARRAGRTPTLDELLAAMEDDLEAVPFEVFAFRLRRFLQCDLREALSTPWQDHDWHVDNRCSGCEYLGYPRFTREGPAPSDERWCHPTATRTDHLSRVAFIPRGATLALRANSIGRTRDLAELPVEHEAFTLHQTLRATRTVISERARVLETEQATIPSRSGTSAVMPRWADLRIYLSADFDLGSAITVALGMSAFWTRPRAVTRQDVPPSRSWPGEVFVVDRKTLDDERREVLGFLQRIEEVIAEAGRLAGRAPTVQVYIWDSLQYDHLVRVVGRHLEAILASPSIFRLAWLFPPEQVVPNPKLATRNSAITIVNEVVRSVLAAPVPHYYTLLDVARTYHRPDLEPRVAEFAVHPLFEGELSDQVPSERAHEIWARVTRPRSWSEQLTYLRRTVLTRLRALEEVTRQLREDLKETLGSTAPVATIGPPDRENRVSPDGQLWLAFARLNAALDSLEVDRIRAMPSQEREARYKSARLRRRLTGDEETEALQRFGLSAAAGRRVYELRETSREVNLRVGEFNFALAPENDSQFLDRRLGKLIEGTPLEGRYASNGYLKMDDITRVAIVGLDRERRWLAVDHRHRTGITLDELEDARIEAEPGRVLSFRQHMVLDPVHRDFLIRPLTDALRAIGNPPSAVSHPLVTMATGQLSGRGANRTRHVPVEDVLWGARTMYDTAVGRVLAGAEARLREIGFTLNETQWQAWRTALSRRMALIWGPPGTGKSRTAQAVVLGALLEAHGRRRPLRVLICASTYTAVDNVLLDVQHVLATRLGDLPIQVARLRSYLRAADAKTPLEIDLVVNRGNPAPELLDLRAALAGREGLILVGGPTQQVYNLAVAGQQPPCQELFDLMLFDEASQTDVAHAILALSTLAEGGSVVLAGDPKQLPPIQAAEPPLGLEAMVGSIYAFMQDHHKVPSVMLDENYRSNATLVEFARSAGYRETLRSVSANLRLNLLNPLPDARPTDWPSDLFWTPEWSTLLEPDRPAACFVYPEGRRSQWNPFEAEAVTALVALLRGRMANRLSGEVDAIAGEARPPSGMSYTDDEFWERAVGVVTPHKAQQAMIVDRLQRLFGATVSTPMLIRDAVDTVERFQGQQRDVIIATFALGDPDAIRDEDEFLMGLNRFNVMASRARAKLIVLVSREVVDHLSSEIKTLHESALLKMYAESFCRPIRAMTLGWRCDHIDDLVPGVYGAR
jgi:DNA replication ATP-dependent helicase Dna2